MSEVGCYVLHLYCDDPAHVEDYGGAPEFTGPSLTHARRDARAAGWQPGRTVTCPACIARKRLTSGQEEG